MFHRYRPVLRKAVALLLMLASVASQPAMAADGNSPAKPLPFSDIAGHWALPVIADLADRGILNGFEDKTFRPDAPMTRAQFLSLTLRVTGLNIDHIRFIKAPDPRDTAPDVSPDAWYAQAVIIAGTLGVLEGGKDFRPDDPILREEMAAWAVKALYAKAGPIYLTEQYILFRDADQVGSGFMPYLQDAYKLHLMQGRDGFIAPRERATRAQGAVVLHNLEMALRSHSKETAANP